MTNRSARRHLGVTGRIDITWRVLYTESSELESLNGVRFLALGEFDGRRHKWVLVKIIGEYIMTRIVAETVGGEPYQYYPLGDHVVRAPGVCGGRPTFKYTRIEITGALERLAAGESLDDIVAGYQGRVSREAIIEAIQLIATQFLQTLPQLELA